MPTRVDVCSDASSDAGSTPAASTRLVVERHHGFKAGMAFDVSTRSPFGVAGRSSQVHRARLHHVADRSRACVRESLENHFKTEVRFKQPLSEHSQIGGANKCRSET